MKLSAVTKINIKNVKKERYDIKRGRCGSCPIYSVEYKCTKLEIEVTTINITAVSVSKRKPHLRLYVSVIIHGESSIKHGVFKRATS